MTPEVMAAIEEEVCRPYVERQENLEEYEATYQEALDYENPPSERLQTELNDYQKELNLRDEDIQDIHLKVRKQLNMPRTSYALSRNFLRLQENYLTNIWQMVTDIVTPPITKTLFQQSCHLVAFNGQSARVDVEPNFVTLVSSRFSKIERAFRDLQGKSVHVELYRADTETICDRGDTSFEEDGPTVKYTQDELAGLWQQVTNLVKPPIAQTLFEQQGRLLLFDGKHVWVGIKSKQLMLLAEQRIEKLHVAFEQVLSNPVTVSLTVIPISEFPTFKNAKTDICDIYVD